MNPPRFLYILAPAVLITSVSAFGTAPGHGQNSGIHVDLRLTTGGAISGTIVTATAHGLVIVRQSTPFVFAWQELESGSAVHTKRTLLARERGGREQLTAEDRFELGVYALSRGRNDLAAHEFSSLRKQGDAFDQRIDVALAQFRSRQESQNRSAAQDAPAQSSGESASNEVASTEVTPSDPSWGELPTLPDNIMPRTSQEIRDHTMAAYRDFGETVKDVMGKQTALVESEHFLIWTDWPQCERQRLAEWAEAMYESLCDQFGVPPDQDIFLAKCPIFCWGSQSQFRKFARLFDGYDARGAEGYTRSVERNGHVHVVLLRNGRSPEDLDRFACTLVHEGTHAFVHRLGGTRLIPHWVNEGLAELTADRVLGERCPCRGNAQLLASEVARRGWRLGGMLQSAGPIEVQAYPIAHSLVAYLESQGRGAFVEFVFALKRGATVDDALSGAYGGMSLVGLEEQWREWARR